MQSERGYFFGFSFGNMLKEGGNTDVDLQQLLQGLQDSLANGTPKLNPQQQNEVIQLIRNKQQAMNQEKEAEALAATAQNLVRAQAFLADNSARNGVQITSTGLQYIVQEKGQGLSPRPEDTVLVHYTGRLLGSDGSYSDDEQFVFDSSHRRGQPSKFGVRQVIPGWTEGLQLMKAGGKARFFIPPELAYGPGGTRGIPPNSLLVFDVELIEVQQAEQ